MMDLFGLKKTTTNAWRKTSYSQSGEDIIVKYIFDAIGITNPTYLDIGAHHPYRLNNTAIFYEAGARGVNVEPDPELYQEFLKHRPQDVNLNIGIGTEPAEIDFYVMSARTLNTFSKKEADRLERETSYRITATKKIPVDTYAGIVKKHLGNKAPDFLSVDVEGLDEVIIKSIDYSLHSPIVICIETISFSENGTGVKNKVIIDFLESKGYLCYADTNINSIFVLTSRWVR